MLNNDKQKKGTQFTILSNDSTDGHGGFGVGTLSLNDVSPVIVDPKEEEAYVDMGALHAKSAVEKNVKFLKNREEVPNAKQYWLVWVTIGHKEGQPYYAGVTACEMLVSQEERRIRKGYKSMPDHVNKMDKSMKRHIIVDEMDAASKQVLADFLKNHDSGMWERSENKLKQELQSE